MCKQETIDKIDKGTHVVVPKTMTIFLTAISPVTLLIGMFYFGVRIENLEGRIFKNAEEKIGVISKVYDQSTHMDYQTKIKTFVPRSEVEYRLEGISKSLDKIEKKLNIN